MSLPTTYTEISWFHSSVRTEIGKTSFPSAGIEVVLHDFGKSENSRPPRIVMVPIGDSFVNQTLTGPTFDVGIPTVVVAQWSRWDIWIYGKDYDQCKALCAIFCTATNSVMKGSGNWRPVDGRFVKPELPEHGRVYLLSVEILIPMHETTLESGYTIANPELYTGEVDYVG